MKLTLIRIIVLLPLVWSLGLTAVWASSGKHKKTSPTGADLAQVDFSHPMAVLATPDVNVEVFRLTRHEDPKSTYMVVRVDEDGTQVSYSDEATVGNLLTGLAKDLHDATQPRRCPAAAGWRFEGQFENHAVRASYCKDGTDTARIERAVDLLATAPPVE